MLHGVSRNIMRRRNWVWALAIYCFLLRTVLLSGQQQLPSPVSSAAVRRIQLIPIPHPNLSAVDPSIKAQVEAAWLKLQTISRQRGANPEALAQAYGETGEVYQAYNFSDAAAACYFNAHALALKEFRWPYYLGRLYQHDGKTKKAIFYLRMAQALRPDNVPTLIHLAQAYAADGQSEPAEADFRKALALDASSAAANAGLGEIALAKSNFTMAIHYLKAALKLQPQATRLRYPLAMAYRGAGDVSQARAQLRQQGRGAVTVRDPLMDELASLKTGQMVFWKNGNQAMHEGRYADAVKAYTRMVGAAEDDPVPRIYLGMALARQGKLKAAEDQYRQALRLAPGNATAHYNLGVILLQLGHDHEAAGQFGIAVGFDPGFTLAHFQLANLLMRRGQYTDAISHYTKVIELNPNNALARLMDAMAFVRLKEYSKAEAGLEAGVAALPQNTDLRSALARLLAACPDKKIRNGPRALALAEKLLADNSSPDFDLVETYGMALASVGRFSEAAQLQKRMILVVEKAGRFNLAALLKQNLVLYERHQACSIPWQDNDPIFTPQPGRMIFSEPKEASRMAMGDSTDR